jgi:iron(III) transport system substrate-binding protein
MPNITRRQTSVGFGALASALFAPVAARADLTKLHEAARKEGEVTWYTSQMTGEAAEAMGKRFARRYPGVAVNAVRTTGQVAYSRLTQELKNNTPHCDVYSSTDVAQYMSLKARGALAHYDVESAGALLPAFQGQGEPGFYYPTTASIQAMVYHTTLLSVNDRPTGTTDLLDPRWKGRIATGHPGFSAWFGQWVLAVRNVHGWKFFEDLARNKPRVGRSGNDPIQVITAGECLIGTGPTSTALQAAEKGNPIGLLYPEDGALLCVGPSAVLANAPHPNASRLLIEWLLSEEYSQACNDWHMEAVRADAPPLSGAKRLSEFKVLTLTAAQIAKGVPEVAEQWRDTFGG